MAKLQLSQKVSSLLGNLAESTVINPVINSKKIKCQGRTVFSSKDAPRMRNPRSINSKRNQVGLSPISPLPCECSTSGFSFVALAFPSDINVQHVFLCPETVLPFPALSPPAAVLPCCRWLRCQPVLQGSGVMVIYPREGLTGEFELHKKRNRL